MRRSRQQITGGFVRSSSPDGKSVEIPGSRVSASEWATVDTLSGVPWGSRTVGAVAAP